MAKFGLTILSVGALFGAVYCGEQAIKRGVAYTNKIVGASYGVKGPSPAIVKSYEPSTLSLLGGAGGHAHQGYFAHGGSSIVKAIEQPALVSLGGGHVHQGHVHQGQLGHVALSAGGHKGHVHQGQIALSGGHLGQIALSGGAPQRYRHAIPAAAIRNVEIIGITKTITPVVTKTITRQTHSEPAISVGHVQGYSQGSIGQPKLAPVQYNTQYTSYANPTIGVNGPVTYTGPAVGSGLVAAAVPATLVGHEGHGHVHGGQIVAGQGYGHVHGGQIVSGQIVGGQGYNYNRGGGNGYLGAPLNFESYGQNIYTIPSSNFIDIKAGQPQIIYGQQRVHAY